MEVCRALDFTYIIDLVGTLPLVLFDGAIWHPLISGNLLSMLQILQLPGLTDSYVFILCSFSYVTSGPVCLRGDASLGLL